MSRHVTFQYLASLFHASNTPNYGIVEAGRYQYNIILVFMYIHCHDTLYFRRFSYTFPVNDVLQILHT